MRIRHRSRRGQAAQSLVLILLILVIGAVIAFGISARTIQDLRRTTQERLSSQAAAQVETMLDVISSDEVWSSLVSDDFTFIGACEGQSPICILPQSTLEGADLMGSLECSTEGTNEGAEVQIRLEDGIVDLPLDQDEAYEVRLTGGSPVTLSWTGEAEYMLAKVYTGSGDGDVHLASDNSHAYARSGTANDWGVSEEPVSVSVPGDALFVRIRPIGGSALVTITGIPGQEASIRASCYMTDVYREFVRRIPRYNSVPACFDYVLFDGSSKIDEFGAPVMD